MNLKEIVQLIWDGDVSYEEVKAKITDADETEINRVLSENKEIFKDGVPFPEDREYGALLKTDIGAQKLQSVINIYERYE